MNILRRMAGQVSQPAWASFVNDWKCALGVKRQNYFQEVLPFIEGSKEVMLLERSVALILQSLRLLSVSYMLPLVMPSLPKRCWRLFAEFYMLAVLFGITVAGVFSDQTHLLGFQLKCVVGYCLVESYVTSFAIVFIADDKGGFGLASARRTIILLILNYLQIAVGFAALYRLTQSIGDHCTVVLEPTTLLYFSVVTITTLGYGDMAPLQETAGRWLVCAEALGGLLLLVVIFASIVPEIQSEQEMANNK